jgi:hypothetical protein
VLTHIHPSRWQFTCRTRPIFNGRGYPGTESGAGQGTPGAQSPFARTRCYLARRGVSHPVRGRYPSFIAHTNSCARPKPSRRLRLSLLRLVFAGCHQSLPGGGPSRRYLRESFPACLDLYPGVSPGAHTRFFPGNIGLHCLGIGSALHNDPYYRSVSTGQPWLVRPSVLRFVTSPHIGYANRPNRAIDGVGTCTPLDSRPCRPLPPRPSPQGALEALPCPILRGLSRPRHATAGRWGRRHRRERAAAGGGGGRWQRRGGHAWVRPPRESGGSAAMSRIIPANPAFFVEKRLWLSTQKSPAVRGAGGGGAVRLAGR